MAYPDRSAKIKLTRAAIAASYGPSIAHYQVPLDYPLLYKWVPNDTTTEDDYTVLGHQGGTIGRWHLVRCDIKGDDLTDADETLVVGENFWRVLPATTPLTAERTKTLGTDNAVAGDILTITRLGAGAFALLVVNGGSGGGTLFTLPSGETWWCKAYFDGTDWTIHSAGQLP